MVTRGVAYLGALAPRDIAARSRAELDRPLTYDAELTIARVSSEAVLLGAFQRGHDVSVESALYRRGSGGAAVRVGPGTLWVSLALKQPGYEPGKILNRHVRPLLRALTKVGATAHYFGRDWISVAHRPAALAGFSHDSATGRTAFEAFVAVATPFALGPRASFLGKVPATLEELVGKSIDMDRVAKAIRDAYAPDGVEIVLPEARVEEEELRADPPWGATIEEAIGEIGAGADRMGRFRVGGDFLVSRDAIAALETRIADGGETAQAVDATLGAPGVAIEGVRSLRSVAEVIDRARR